MLAGLALDKCRQKTVAGNIERNIELIREPLDEQVIRCWKSGTNAPFIAP
jgi:hypothetical protein